MFIQFNGALMRAVCTALVLFAGPSLAQMRVHFIDVGQGAATLLEFPCGAILVDTGGEANDDFKSSEELKKYLDNFFDRKRPDLRRTLDSVVLTHPHIDHTRGVQTVLANYTVNNAITNGQAVGSGRSGQKALHDHFAEREESGDSTVRHVAAWRHEIPKGKGKTDAVIDPVACKPVDPKITLLWGSSREQGNWKSEEFKDQNNHSVVLRVEYGKASMLITGDLEETAINDLVAYYKGTALLNVDLYQVGHHGSHNGTTESLLAAMTPDYAVMATSSPDRRAPWTAWAYGHPRRPTVDMLTKYIRKTRPEVVVPVASAVKKFAGVRISKALYATGWDGGMIFEATAAGVWTRYSLEEPDLPHDEAEAVVLVNLNTATVAELMALPMIGAARATAIVSRRETVGPYRSVEDLLGVARIGTGTVNALRNLVSTN